MLGADDKSRFEEIKIDYKVVWKFVHSWDTARKSYYEFCEKLPKHGEKEKIQEEIRKMLRESQRLGQRIKQLKEAVNESRSLAETSNITNVSL